MGLCKMCKPDFHQSSASFLFRILQSLPPLPLRSGLIQLPLKWILRKSSHFFSEPTLRPSSYSVYPANSVELLRLIEN
jgi:hypothetical protein